MNNVWDDLTAENLARHNEIFDQIDADLEMDEQRKCWDDSSWSNRMGTSADDFLKSSEEAKKTDSKSSTTASTPRSLIEQKLHDAHTPKAMSQAEAASLMASIRQVEANVARLRISLGVQTKKIEKEAAGKNARHVETPRRTGYERIGTWKGFERIPREKAGGVGVKGKKSAAKERRDDDKCVVC